MRITLSGQLRESEYAKNIFDKFSLKFENEEELLDVLFVSMTILSYTMVKRTELMIEVDQIMLTYLPQLINPTTSVLIRNRVALFFSFYLDQAFQTLNRQKQEELFESILMFLLTSLGLPKSDKIVAL